MICETCHGQGKILSPFHSIRPNGVICHEDGSPLKVSHPLYVPCPQCGGCGTDYCCGPSAIPDMVDHGDREDGQ